MEQTKFVNGGPLCRLPDYIVFKGFCKYFLESPKSSNPTTSHILRTRLPFCSSVYKHERQLLGGSMVLSVSPVPPECLCSKSPPQCQDCCCLTLTCREFACFALIGPRYPRGPGEGNFRRAGLRPRREEWSGSSRRSGLGPLHPLGLS